MKARFAQTALITCVVAALGAAGCAPSFDHLQMDARTSPPLPVTLAPTDIEVPVGIAVAFTATPMSGQDKLDKTVTLTSTDPTVLGVSDDASGQGFILFGVAPGKAGMNVVLDGEQQEVIHAVVSPQ
jgi:hypothetical protein